MKKSNKRKGFRKTENRVRLCKHSLENRGELGSKEWRENEKDTITIELWLRQVTSTLKQLT